MFGSEQERWKRKVNIGQYPFQPKSRLYAISLFSLDKTRIESAFENVGTLFYEFLNSFYRKDRISWETLYKSVMDSRRDLRVKKNALEQVGTRNWEAGDPMLLLDPFSVE